MKKTTYFLIHLICCLTYLSADSSDFTIIPNEAQIPLKNPDLAGRQVLKLKLANSLEVYLISDPTADKSGAELTVQAGSWDDPEEYPGIAHFLEHMLFLGTKKYPEESSYQRFISEHGGSTNAFTGTLQTSYLFSVNNDAFEEALSRFSEFFKEPLFNPSGVSRELQAINQEYSMHLDNDDMRGFMVDKELANPKHPYHNFNIGNIGTLSQVSRETFLDWYQKHYSANLMRLVVYSSMPLDQLLDLVVGDFKAVPNRNLKAFTSNEPLHVYQDKPSIVYVNSIKNTRNLQLVWDLPERFANMTDTLPSQMLCYILGHEGEESLLAELKRKHLADKLQCGQVRLSPQNMEIYLEIELTDEGLEHVEDVITLVFETIAFIKEKGYPSYLFDEIHQMGVINYEYQAREDAFEYLMKHATWGPYEELPTYPEKTLIVQKFDPAAIQDLINELKPAQTLFYVTAPSNITKVTPIKTEKWMHVEYGFKPIDERTFQQWQNAADKNKSIDLPPKNPFIPQHLLSPNLNNVSAELKNFNLKENIPTPSTILNDKRGIVYFSKDQHYHMPQVGWIFEIKTPEVEIGSATKTILADLYVKSLREELRGISYPANLAGLSYEIVRKDNGIQIGIDGYSDKAEALFDEILKRLKQVRLTEVQLETYRQALRRDYQNFSKKSPFQQAAEYLKQVLYKKFSTEKQKSVAINRVSQEKFNQYSESLFNQAYVQGMLYGDMELQQADRLTKKLLNTLEAKPYAKGATKRPEIIKLSEHQGPYLWEVATKAQGNAVILAIEYPTFNFKERAAQQVLMQAIENPFFATLRTKQQTGYVVYSEGKDINRQLFNIFGVQSSTHSVRDLLARFELFLETFLQEMPLELPRERFEQIKQAVLHELKEPPKTIKEMTDLLQALAVDFRGDFSWIAKRIQGLEELNYETFVQLAKANLGKSNTRRMAILLKGEKDQGTILEYSPIGSLIRLRKASEYTDEK